MMSFSEDEGVHGDDDGGGYDDGDDDGHDDDCGRKTLGASNDMLGSSESTSISLIIRL